jgi:hypothetical protein
MISTSRYLSDRLRLRSWTTRRHAFERLYMLSVWGNRTISSSWTGNRAFSNKDFWRDSIQPSPTATGCIPGIIGRPSAGVAERRLLRGRCRFRGRAARRSRTGKLGEQADIGVAMLVMDSAQILCRVMEPLHMDQHAVPKALKDVRAATPNVD